MPEKPKPKAAPRPPTYADIVRELQASGDLPPAQWVPPPQRNPGYAYEAPDPMEQAAHFAQRQEAARQLASPMSPVLEVPGEVVAAQKKLGIPEQIMAAWRSLRGTP